MSKNGTLSSTQPFLGESFLLENDYARALYHDYAQDQPIIDYHNHLPPQEVATNRRFETITQLWLNGDHYKWRAMRAHGIPEHYITGAANDLEKFQKWAETVPYTLRNPLYHWTHLELSRYFGIEERLNAGNATELYHNINAQLADDSYTVQGLLHRMKVDWICTTDDPLDSLEHHIAYAKKNPEIAMYPAFRPDKALSIARDSYMDYIEALSAITDIPISSYFTLLDALINRLDFFHLHGCRICDHGLDQLPFEQASEQEVNLIFQKRLAQKPLTNREVRTFQIHLLLDLCRAYHERGWVQQFHLGALRNNNARMLQQLGPDTGWDSIGDWDQARGLSQFLNALDETNQLAKTILYNLNPRDNAVFATMIGNFNDGSIAGKVQWGSGWWFMDQLDGMEQQINTLSNMGLISHFIGMLTDSRSFLSFPRHEYFRRLLCNLFGKDVERGLLPNDLPWIGQIIQNICYDNAKNYFPTQHNNLVRGTLEG